MSDAPATTAPGSIAALFLDQVARHPDRHAYSHPSPNGVQRLTWSQTADLVTALAAGLIDLGVRPEDRVALVSGTRIDWVVADTAIMCAGAATTTVYPTTAPEDCAYILADSGSVVVFAEDADQIAKIQSHAADLPAVRAIVSFETAGEPDPKATPDAAVSGPSASEDGGGGPGGDPGPEVLSIADLEVRGRAVLEVDPDLVTRTVAEIGPEQLATLIYTSGTTGRPKGVRLVHANWLWEADAQATCGLLREDDLHYLWLPLSHSFGKTLLCGQFAVGFHTYVDGRIETIVDSLGEVRPTVMAGAPRIYEKVYARVTSTAEQAGGAKAKIFRWALGVGGKVVALRERGRQPSGLLAVQFAIADRLVFGKLRARFGGRVRVLVSGAAALSREVAEFFHAAGMPLLEGYGLTETSAAVYVNRLDQFRLGSVGVRLGDVETRIAEDGEVLVRGGPVMRGYHNLPKETAAALDPDGWFHTGDIGELSGGFLSITDRKKDLVKTSGGKYIAPSYIEGLVKVHLPYAGHSLLHTRNYCTLLVTLDPDAIRGWADANGLADVSYAELVVHPDVRALVSGAVDQVNAKLNRWETIKDFAVLPEDFTVANGELTPSMKVKRAVVEKRYRPQLDALYEKEPAAS